MKKGVEVCGKAAKFGVAALKNFCNIQRLDFTVYRKWQKLPKKSISDIFAIISKNDKFRPIVPLEVEYTIN